MKKIVEDSKTSKMVSSVAPLAHKAAKWLNSKSEGPQRESDKNTKAKNPREHIAKRQSKVATAKYDGTNKV